MLNTQVLLARRPEGMVSTEDFSVQTAEVPSLSDGQVQVAVKYLSLDPAMRGWMNPGTTYIKGVEVGAVMRAFAAGEVVASADENFQAGDLVSGLLGAQSQAIVSAKFLTKIPSGLGSLSWYLGVLGMPGMTAYFGLLERSQPQAGDTVVITGAAGIVGSTVGQIAKIKGCRVVGTAGSEAKCKYLVEECGFDHAINYKTDDVRARLKEYCPDGVNVFFDNVGGPLMDTVLARLAHGARVVICGAISQYNSKEIYGPKNYMKIVTARATMTGIIVFDFTKNYPTAVKELAGWLQSGQMHTKEHIEEGIENFAATLKMLYTGENFGKLLLKVG